MLGMEYRVLGGMPSEVKVTSDSDPLKTYTVNVKKLSCTCPAFTKGHANLCKHLQRLVTLPMMTGKAEDLPAPITVGQELKTASFIHWANQQVGKGHLLRDFLFHAPSVILGVPFGTPKRAVVARAGIDFCARVFDCLQCGVLITNAYQGRPWVEAQHPHIPPGSSYPHHWDRGTFGTETYARCEFKLTQFGEDPVSFGKHLLKHLDIDLLMYDHGHDTYSATISPQRRKVFIEWNSAASPGKPIIHYGKKFWTTPPSGLTEHMEFNHSSKTQGSTDFV